MRNLASECEKIETLLFLAKENKEALSVLKKLSRFKEYENCVAILKDQKIFGKEIYILFKKKCEGDLKKFKGEILRRKYL
jgi:hypothetical protein